MTYLLALDQGTSSSRSIVFDSEGRIVAMAQRELTQIYPQPGWVEHDPMEIWQSQLATAREVLVKAKLQPADIHAIGITNQRETTVLWNRKTGLPVHHAIVWQDRRAEPLCAKLRDEGMTGTIQEKTGLVIDAYFSGTKLRWLLDNVPGARAQAERGELAFGTVDSWLMWQLTGGKVHVTDVSNASRTMLFNVHRNEWDADLLKLLDIPAALMPKVQPSSSHFADTDAALLGRALPIGGVAGDQQSALFGQACFAAGMAKNTYGTGCFLLMHTGAAFQPSHNGLLVTSAAQTDATPQYAMEGSVFVGGAVVQWLRDGLGIIEKSADIEALAASVPDSDGVYFVPAFTGLGAPHWDARARGTMVGLSRGTTRAHIARAALEAIAFQSAEVLAAMQKDAARPLIELRVDGGATANNLLMQFQADVLGVPVVRPRITETTALGAAYLAGLGVGFWRSPDDLARNWQVERRFEPRMSRDEATDRLRRWSQAVERSRQWAVDSHRGV